MKLSSTTPGSMALNTVLVVSYIGYYWLQFSFVWVSCHTHRMIGNKQVKPISVE